MSDQLPEIGDVTVDRIHHLDIRVVRGGNGVGLPILLTSPWPESIYAFRDVLPALSKAGPLLAIDLPGFGMSDGRSDLMSPKAMAGFIISVAEHFGIDRLHAVGPDIGELALLFAAAERPTMFESLIVGSGAASAELAAGGLVDLIASPRGASADAEGGDIGVSFVTGAARKPIPASVLDDYRKSSSGRRFEDATNFVRTYPDELPVLKRMLPAIKTPVLVLAGRDDAVVPPPNGQLIRDLLPNSRYVLLDGGHLVWEDAAEAYASEICQWVSGGYKCV